MRACASCGTELADSLVTDKGGRPWCGGQGCPQVPYRVTRKGRLILLAVGIPTDDADLEAPPAEA